MNDLRDNPFLQGAAIASDYVGDATDRILRVRKKEAVESFLTNLGVLKSRIQEREQMRQSQYYKNVVDLMNQPGSTGGMTVDEFAVKQAQDQKKLAALNLGFEIENAKDKALGQELINDNMFLVSQMDPQEAAAVGYFEPKVAGALQRLMGRQLNVTGGGVGGVSKMQFKTISNGDRTVYGSFDPATGTFYEQGNVDDPLMGLDAQKKAMEIQNKYLSGMSTQMDIAKKQDAMSATTMDSQSMSGNQRHDVVSMPVKPEWASMDEAQLSEAVQAEMAMRGLSPKDWSPVVTGGRIEFHRRGTDKFKSSSSSSSSKKKPYGYTPKQLRDKKTSMRNMKVEIKQLMQEGKTGEARTKMQEYNNHAQELIDAGMPGVQKYKTDFETQREWKRRIKKEVEEFRSKRPDGYTKYWDMWEDLDDEERMHYGGSFDRFIAYKLGL